MTKHKPDDRLQKVIDAGITAKRGRKPGSASPKGPRTELIQIPPSTPGYKLVQMLFEEAAARSKTLKEVSEESGVGLSTLSHLRTGRRLASQLERDIVKRIADWLGLPPLAAMMLAEQVTLQDFYSAQSDLQDNIKRALKYIASDPDWGVMMPRDVETWADDAKLFVIWCYEQATQTKLLGGGVNYQDLLEQLERFREEHPAADDRLG